ncbi:hypothetical protein PCURB6_40020 [Paenibacillus curdlanolyticus]|nr:hypothetical protein PCURB6_40020 [Paenibacillus curdlanolyticus]
MSGKLSLIDTHTHMDHHKFDSDREEAIARAREAGVELMINIGFDRETIPTTMELVERYDFFLCGGRLASSREHSYAAG